MRPVPRACLLFCKREVCHLGLSASRGLERLCLVTLGLKESFDLAESARLTIVVKTKRGMADAPTVEHFARLSPTCLSRPGAESGEAGEACFPGRR